MWNALQTELLRLVLSGEYYAETIWKGGIGQVERSRHWEEDYSVTSHQSVSPGERPLWFEGDRLYSWNVIVLYYAGETDGKDIGSGKILQVALMNLTQLQKVLVATSCPVMEVLISLDLHIQSFMIIVTKQTYLLQAMSMVKDE